MLFRSPNSTDASLHVGKPIQRNLITKNHAGAACCVDGGIRVNLAFAPQSNRICALDIGREGNAATALDTGANCKRELF